MKYSFSSKLQRLGGVCNKVDRSVIRDETLLFGASILFARNSCGPLTNMVIGALEDELIAAEKWCSKNGRHVVIDTRSHMLMRGFYPAIPGWHCDGYPRRAYLSQPDLLAGNPECVNYVCHVSDQDCGVSNTLFLDEESFVVDVDVNSVWSSVHKAAVELEKTTDGNNLFQQEDGDLIEFNQETLHRAQAAKTRGWRWWFRASCYYKPPKNDIRKQVQVYAPEGLGW